MLKIDQRLLAYIVSIIEQYGQRGAVKYFEAAADECRKTSGIERSQEWGRYARIADYFGLAALKSHLLTQED